MITPIVNEIHDDNHPLHMYMDDPVRKSIDKLTTHCVELYCIKWHIIKYVPIFILNKFKVPVSMTQSIGFKVNYIVRHDVSNMVTNVQLSRHVKSVIDKQLMGKLQMLEKGYK